MRPTPCLLAIAALAAAVALPAAAETGTTRAAFLCSRDGHVLAIRVLVPKMQAGVLTLEIPRDACSKERQAKKPAPQQPRRAAPAPVTSI